MDINNQLTEKIDALISLVKKVDTLNVIGMISVEFTMNRPGDSVFEITDLISPFKQYLYLCSLLLSNEYEPSEEQEENFEELYKEIKKLLNEVTNLYALIFFPEDDEEISDEWRKHRELTMPVFMNYFNIHSLVYEEQIIERIQGWSLPYNTAVQEALGIDIETMISLYNEIKSDLDKGAQASMPSENVLGKLNEAKEKLEESRQYFLKLLEGNQELDFDSAMELTREAFKDKIDLNDLGLQEIKSVQNNSWFKLNLKNLEEKFPKEVVERFLSLFLIERSSKDFYYYTAVGPFEINPIVKIDDEYYLPIFKQLLHAINTKVFTAIENSDFRDSFYKNRDNKAEEKTRELFEKLYGKTAQYYSSVFETPDSQNEHDLLVRTKDGTVFLVEVKASKYKEPFRDPDRAYQRIKRDFKSDGGIQKAYNQGKKLKDLLNQNEIITLYNKEGEEVVTLNSKDIKKIHIICVTAENFGIIASNLSYLLEKEESELYPFAVNLYDLELIVDYIKFKSLGEKSFVDYLNFRQLYHKKFIATDELDIFGYFLSKPDYKIFREQDIIFVSPENADIIDEMYFSRLGIYKKEKKLPVKSKKEKNKRKMKKLSKKRNRKK
ncbi:hypothetical protein CN341_19705 [Bacillus cereus]|uniref:NERD domain-containing protein n=1 Tax=Bacillus cereus TaxID=1396 RepID=UPI000BF43E67|nr:NERD domain-containing protein [Bacillus cereus]PFF75825.1 hypothetical protein CN341_19705 [Bacillus cereus]